MKHTSDFAETSAARVKSVKQIDVMFKTIDNVSKFAVTREISVEYRQEPNKISLLRRHFCHSGCHFPSADLTSSPNERKFLYLHGNRNVCLSANQYDINLTYKVSILYLHSVSCGAFTIIISTCAISFAFVACPALVMKFGK